MTVLCLPNYSFSPYSRTQRSPKILPFAPLSSSLTIHLTWLSDTQNFTPLKIMPTFFSLLPSSYFWQKCHRHLEFLWETNPNPHVPPKPLAPPAFSVLAKEVFIYLGWKAYSLPSLLPVFYSQHVIRFCFSAKCLVLSIPSFHCRHPSLNFHQLLCGLFLKSNQPSCLPSRPSHPAPVKSTSSH